MNIRNSIPEFGNKFYNNRAGGGYSWCITGNPTRSGLNVLSNCVGYACGRFNEIIGSMKYPQLNCNAENFIERGKECGLELSDVPTLGGIMVWEGLGSLAGHVAVVERIDNANQIYTSESNYGGTAFFNAVRNNNNGRWGLSSSYKFRGCLVNPAIGRVIYIPPVTSPQEDTETLAIKVLNGEYGNGEERRNKLGNRYDEVQARVNQILSEQSQNQNNNELLELVKKTIRGDFGNGEARKQALGNYYQEVQRQINLNIQNGLTRWDNIRLF